VAYTIIFFGMESFDELVNSEIAANTKLGAQFD
jgi:hypothetical protein